MCKNDLLLQDEHFLCIDPMLYYECQFVHHLATTNPIDLTVLSPNEQQAYQQGLECLHTFHSLHSILNTLSLFN